MELPSANRRASEELQYIVRNVRPVKIFYAFHGRNAWWSTWITRYAEGCMHDDWGSTKEYCEKQRVQGTVFYTNELPAIAFITGERALIVSQINTSDILSQLNFALLTQLSTLVPFRTMTLEQLTHIFKPTSSFWPASFPQSNSIVQVYSDNATRLNDLSALYTLTHKKSRAVGTNYYLNWSEQPSDIKFDVVISLADTLMGGLSES